jgi:hypothetical protein
MSSSAENTGQRRLHQLVDDSLASQWRYSDHKGGGRRLVTQITHLKEFDALRNSACNLKYCLINANLYILSLMFLYNTMKNLQIGQSSLFSMQDVYVD